MADTNFEYTPKLTLDAGTASEPKAPELQFGAQETAQKKIEAVPDYSLESLSEAEQKAVHDFEAKIDITDTNAILQYGSGAQKNISDFSGAALENVRTKDMGEVGDNVPITCGAASYI